MADVVVAPEAPPVLPHDLLHGLLLHRQQVEPEEHRPEAVLLADVVGAGAEALLAADGDSAGVEQVAEEFPARGRLETLDPQLGRDPVDRLAGRHGARDPRNAAAVAGDQVGVGCDDGQAVARRHEEVAAKDHVAVPVAVGGRREVDGVVTPGHLHQRVGVHQVGVGVTAPEVLEGFPVDDGPRLGAEAPLEYALGIGAGDGVHGVEPHSEQAGVEQAVDRVEVEQRLHELRVVVDRVDHVHRHRAEAGAADGVEVDAAPLDREVTVDHEGALVDRLGHLLRGGAAVGDVELDAEVLVRPARVVAGREDQAALGAVLANHAGGGRGGEEPALADDDPADPVGRRHAQDGLRGRAVVEAAVSADHQRAAREVRAGVEDRLDEVLQVAGLLEYADLLAQAGGAGALVREGVGLDL